MQGERGIGITGGDVDQALADPHEGQRRGNADDADEHADEDPPPDGTGHGAQAPEDLAEGNHLWNVSLNTLLNPLPTMLPKVRQLSAGAMGNILQKRRQCSPSEYDLPAT